MSFKLNTIIQGDTYSVLKTFPDESVDMIITSPPYYGLRSYLPKDHPDKQKEVGSESSMEEHLKVLLEIIGEVKRVLKPSGSFWLNYGDAYSSSNWLGDKPGKYDSQTINTGNDIHGRAATPNYQDKCLLVLPERIALRMIDQQGWILRSKIIWAKQIYDGKERRTKGSVMPTSVKDRFNTSWEYMFHFVKNKKYYFDLDAVRIPAQTMENRPDGFTRSRELNYDSKFLNEYGQPKQSGHRKLQVAEYRDKNGTIHWGKYGQLHPSKNPRWNPGDMKNLPNVWLIGTEPSKELHFARFPTALCEIPIKSSCPPNGIVLDIFSGSGTALAIARHLGRNFIGIELSEEYIKLANNRLAQKTLL